MTGSVVGIGWRVAAAGSALLRIGVCDTIRSDATCAGRHWIEAPAVTEPPEQ